MKKLILSVAALLFAGTMFAQFSSGQKLIGGQLSFSRTKYQPVNQPGYEQQNNNFGISFSYGQFSSPTKVFGFGIQYNYYDSRYTNTGAVTKSKNNSLGAYAELTKLQPIAKKLYLAFTGTGGVNYNYGRNDNANSSYDETKGYTIYLSGGMGLWYQLNRHFILTGNVSNLLNISYSHADTRTFNTTGTLNGEGRSNSFALTTGLSSFSLNSFNIGVRYLL